MCVCVGGTGDGGRGTGGGEGMGWDGMGWDGNTSAMHTITALAGNMAGAVSFLNLFSQPTLVIN